MLIDFFLKKLNGEKFLAGNPIPANFPQKLNGENSSQGTQSLRIFHGESPPYSCENLAGIGNEWGTGTRSGEAIPGPTLPHGHLYLSITDPLTNN